MTEQREMFGRIDASPPRPNPEQEPDAEALVAAVREREAHLQLAIETAEMGTWRWAAGSEHDNRDANLNHMLGLHATPSTQPVGQTLDFVHPEDRMRIEAVLAQTIAELRTYDVAFRILRRDGSLRWLRARGRVVAGTPPVVIGVVVDLSDQIRATTRNARLHGVTAALAAALTPHEVAEVIIQQALGALEADAGAVYALGGDDPTYTLLSSRGYPADFVERRRSAGPRLPGPIRAALETRELVLAESPVELLARWPDLASTPEGASLAATAVVPLEVEHRLLGVFYAAFRYPRDFAADEIAFLRTLGHQCALALERARLYVAEQVQRAAAEQSAARLARLQAITAALSRAHTPSEVAQVIMGEGLSALGAYAGALVVAHPDRSIFEAVAAPNYSVATWPPVTELPWDADLPILAVARTGNPLWVEDRDAYATRFPHLVERSPTTQALAAVPLVIGETIFGAFGLSFDQPQAFVAEERAAIATLAEQAAQAIQRGRLLDAEQRARHAADHARNRAEFLAEASRVLATSLDYEATLQQVANLAVPRIADWAFVEILKEDGSIRRMAMAAADPRKQALAREYDRRYPLDPDAPVGSANVIRTGQPELIPHIPDALLEAVAIDAEHLRLLRGLGFRSSMIVPLNTGGRTLGDLALVAAESGRTFTEDDLMMAMELAARCALAVDNARLYHDTQEAVRARDEFLAIASHELKTPLTGLLGYVELLERRSGRLASGDERDSRALARIRQQAERLQRLIADVLDLSRIQLGVFAVERRPMDLAQMVRDVVEEIRPTLQRHQLELVTAPANVPIEGDRRGLEQVVENLVSNAAKYSPDGGAITVEVRTESNSAVVLVSDRGIGIPPDEQARLFQRFYRAANVKTQQISGFGIGLYLVHEIVTRHDGTIKVTSEEGHGTTFTIVLPLAGEPMRDETQ